MHKVQGFIGRDVVIKGPYNLPVEICGMRLIHPFYMLDTPTPCVAGYDLISAAQMVIDSVRQCAWSYHHPPTNPPPFPHSVHTVSANPPSTSVSPAEQWLDSCLRLIGVDPLTVDPPSTELLQLPCTPSSSNASLQSPSAPFSLRAPVLNLTVRFTTPWSINSQSTNIRTISTRWTLTLLQIL